MHIYNIYVNIQRQTETDKENHKTNVIKCQNLDNLKGIQEF